jgi:hypothetical protein
VKPRELLGRLMNQPALVIEDVPPDAPEALALIHALDADLRDRYPESAMGIPGDFGGLPAGGHTASGIASGRLRTLVK